VRFYEEIRKEKQQRVRRKTEVKSNKGLAKENKGCMKEAEDLYSSLNIVRVIKSRRMR